VVRPRGLAVGVLPLDADGRVALVGQWRYPLARYSWEMPEGGGDKAVAPIETARRELREETGLAAGAWREILRMDLSNAISDEHAICFLAWDLTEGRAEPEGTEQLALRRVPFAAVLDEVLDGRIADSLTVATVLKADCLARRGLLPAAVARLICG
jgi:8-oxo-dGTP pyrophosphatase MutT (NUDIX family)